MAEIGDRYTLASDFSILRGGKLSVYKTEEKRGEGLICNLILSISTTAVC